MTIPDDMHDHLQRYARSLLRGADDDDPERRNVGTAERYINDLKWYGEWLAGNGLEPTEVSKLDSEDLGYDLVDEFNGTTQIVYCELRRLR